LEGFKILFLLNITPMRQNLSKKKSIFRFLRLWILTLLLIFFYLFFTIKQKRIMNAIQIDAL